MNEREQEILEKTKYSNDLRLKLVMTMTKQQPSQKAPICKAVPVVHYVPCHEDTSCTTSYSVLLIGYQPVYAE